jgi:hypothetical protein
MREDLQWRLAFCFLKVPRSGLFFAESKLVLAESSLVLAGPALGGAGAKKSAQKAQKAPGVGPDEVESAAGEGWKACPGTVWCRVRCRNVRIKLTKLTKSAGRLAMPWMTRWHGRQAPCFLKALKSGLYLAESKLVLAEPPLNGVWAKKSALKALKVPPVRPGGVESAAGEAWRGCPENMRDKRGMRDKGLPENTRTKRTMRTKVLPVRLRDLWVPRPGELTRRCRVG